MDYTKRLFLFQTTVTVPGTAASPQPLEKWHCQCVFHILSTLQIRERRNYESTEREGGGERPRETERQKQRQGKALRETEKDGRALRSSNSKKKRR